MIDSTVKNCFISVNVRELKNRENENVHWSSKHVLQLAPEKAKIQSTNALETVSVILDIST